MQDMLIANVIAVISVLYLFWKRLKEDYPVEKVFNLSFITIILVAVASLVSKYFLPSWWFWLACIAVLISLFIAYKLYKVRIYEYFEVLIVSFFIWLGLVFLADSIIHSLVTSFIAFWVVLIFIFLYFLFSANYRKFTWYKSGRVGFSGLVTLGGFFVLRGASNLVNVTMISIVGNIDLILSLIVALISFGLLYNLSKLK